MNINQEKEAVFKIIMELTAERRRLSDERFLLTQEIGMWKERLNDLSKLEEKGLDNLDIKGYFDLMKQAEKELQLKNIVREAEHIIEKEMPKMEEKQEENKLFTTAEQEKQKDKEARSRVGKATRTTGESLKDKAVMILKTEGIPMKADTLKQKIEEQTGEELPYKKFANSVLNQINKHNKISKPARGIYQYNF